MIDVCVCPGRYSGVGNLVEYFAPSTQVFVLALNVCGGVRTLSLSLLRIAISLCVCVHACVCVCVTRSSVFDIWPLVCLFTSFVFHVLVRAHLCMPYSRKLRFLQPKKADRIKCPVPSVYIHDCV